MGDNKNVREWDNNEEKLGNHSLGYKAGEEMLKEIEDINILKKKKIKS